MNLAPLGPQPVRTSLKPSDPTLPHLTHRAPEACQHEEDGEEQEFAPRSLEECVEDAYNFDKNFHKRGGPPFPQEQWAKATPARQAVLTKRRKSRVKRAQQPVHAQRDIQRKSLLRRARRDSARGYVSVSYKVKTTIIAAVVQKDYFKLCFQWIGLSRRLIWRFCVINLTRATGWESSARELAWASSNVFNGTDNYRSGMYNSAAGDLALGRVELPQRLGKLPFGNDLWRPAE